MARAGGTGPKRWLEVEPLEQLHDVVEDTFRRHAEVVQSDRVRRVQRGRGLCLALEAADQGGCLDRGLEAEQLGTDQLDRHRTRQHQVARPPDLAHSAVVQLLHELVAAELLESSYHDRREHGEGNGNVVLKEFR